MSVRPALLAIVNGTAIDGTGADPIPDAAVIVQGNRIVSVGRAAELGTPPGATVVDAGGATILPGIVDSHAHTTFDPAVRREFLTYGITSVCDLGSEIDTMPQNDRSRVRGRPTSRGRAARGFCAGSMVTVPGGLPDAFFGSRLNYEVRSPEEARSAVADLQGRGADVIKVFLHRTANGRTFPILSLEQIEALVQEAHARGMPVRAHVWDSVTTEVALAGGVDVIEHGPKLEILPEVMAEILAAGDAGRDPLSAALDRLAPQLAARKRQFEQMVTQGILFVPTLERYRWGFESGATPKAEVDLWVGLDLAGVRLFHELGGMVALGTDSNTGLDEREFVLRELEFYARAGLAPLEVIQAAMRHAARACGQSDVLGKLEPGKLADVIVVDGDPLLDIRALANVRVVIVGGEIAYRKKQAK
jgi:imidazolonepropionase-like amidohydrolase